MGAWVLILTLKAGSSVAITSVPGFADKGACAWAGVQWAANAETQLHVITSMTCVQPHESPADTTVPK